MGNAQREHKSAKSREWYSKNTTKTVKSDILMFLYKHWIGSMMKRLEMKIESYIIRQVQASHIKY